MNGDQGLDARLASETNAYLLFFPEGEQTDTRYLDDLEPHTGNITLGLATTTETRDEYFVVLVDKVKATIILRII